MGDLVVSIVTFADTSSFSAIRASSTLDFDKVDGILPTAGVCQIPTNLRGSKKKILSEYWQKLKLKLTCEVEFEGFEECDARTMTLFAMPLIFFEGLVISEEMVPAETIIGALRVCWPSEIWKK